MDRGDVKMGKRLYLSKKDKKLAGVCGGIAEYMDVDPTIIRLGWVLFSLAGGAGVLGYIIAMLIIPQQPNFRSSNIVEAEIIEDEDK